MMRRYGRAVALLALALGCESTQPGASMTSDEADAAVTDMAPGDAVPPDADPWPVPDPGAYVAIEPGGETVCSRNTPFRFFVRGGRADRVIIDFQGGGACWNELTCSIAGSLFKEEAGELPDLELLMEAGFLKGIYDPDPANPFHDWTLVHVPYCTGDIHWGDAVHDYGNGVVIHHKGYPNARAALDWVYGHFETPEQIFVTGCSAGAYGSILHSAYVAQHYPDARVAVLADSGCGIITESFLNDSMPNWGAQVNIPPFIEALHTPISELSLADLYIAVAEYFPQHRFTQVTSAFDLDQISYFLAMGGERHDWSPQMRESLSAIEAGVPNFRAYVAPGSMHCIIPYPFMTSRTVDGVAFTDWVDTLIEGEEMPATVACEGESCFDDPVCETCAETPMPWCGFCRGWPEEFRPPETP